MRGRHNGTCRVHRARSNLSLFGLADHPARLVGLVEPWSKAFPDNRVTLVLHIDRCDAIVFCPTFEPAAQK